MILSAASIKFLAPYKDSYFEMLEVDPFKLDQNVPFTKEEIKKPENFDSTALIKCVENFKTKDGIYNGTIRNDVPDGYGVLLFNSNENGESIVNHHP